MSERAESGEHGPLPAGSSEQFCVAGTEVRCSQSQEQSGWKGECGASCRLEELALLWSVASEQRSGSQNYTLGRSATTCEGQSGGRRAKSRARWGALVETSLEVQETWKGSGRGWQLPGFYRLGLFSFTNAIFFPKFSHSVDIVKSFFLVFSYVLRALNFHVINNYTDFVVCCCEKPHVLLFYLKIRKNFSRNLTILSVPGFSFFTLA